MNSYMVQKAYTKGITIIESSTPEGAAEIFFKNMEYPPLNNLIAVDNLVFKVSNRDKLYIQKMNDNYTQRG